MIILFCFVVWIGERRETAVPILPGAGETVTIKITLKNPRPTLPSVSLTSVIQAQTTYTGGLSASSGTPTYGGEQASWGGSVPAGIPVMIQFNVTVNGGVTDPTPFMGLVNLDDREGNQDTLSLVVIANGLPTYLPAVSKA